MEIKVQQKLTQFIKDYAVPRAFPHEATSKHFHFILSSE